MTTYTTFLGALTDTIAAIHNEGNSFSTVNGFEVKDMSDGCYYAKGEAWAFYLRHDPDAEGWNVTYADSTWISDEFIAPDADA